MCAEVAERNGDDSYSGDINTVNFHFAGSWANMTKQEIDKAVDAKLDYIAKRDGNVYRLGEAGKLCVKTKIEEATFCPFDSRAYLRTAKKGPAVLLESLKGSNWYRVVDEGTVTELRATANEMLRKAKYSTEYYIVGRGKNYIATYDAKYHKTTKRVSDDKVLVLPLYQFLYFGLAAE